MRIALGFAITACLVVAGVDAVAQTLADDQVKQEIIKQSVASYPGRCPCPWNLASNGSRCGKRSAYSRAGGYSPVCYAQDVTPEMIKQYRLAHGG